MSLSCTSIILLADIIALTIFFVCVLIKLGIPSNLSITYYMFDKKKRFLFPCLTMFFCCTAIPIWILMTYHASPWGSMFLGLPITTLICMLSVVASMHYKKNQKLLYFHYITAIVSAVCLVAWINIVAYSIAYVATVILLAFVYAGIRTKTLKKSSLFWLETAAFYSLFFTLLTIDLFHVRI